MISLIGVTGTPEWDAAERVQSALVELWPDLASSDQDRVLIMSNCKIYGHEVQDLDVVLCLLFRNHRAFQPLRPVPCQQDGHTARRDVYVRSVVAAIEVKGHDSRAVRFEGAIAEVLYAKNGKQRWHDATDQSLKQAHALKSYLRDISQAPVFVTNLLLFDNLEESDLPRRPHNILPGMFSGRGLMTAIAEIARPWVSPNDGRAQLSSAKDEVIARSLVAPAFKLVEPSAIDRQRMERIARRAGLKNEWFTSLGEKQVILRGRGGTGKTVGLLQLAHRAYEERGARTLILTYNLALVADMRRILTLLRLPSAADEGGVRIDSVMSFVGKVLGQFGMLEGNPDFLERYDGACAELAANFRSGDFPQDEIRDLLASATEKFGFDYVMVDEGQDWPMHEIEILRGCYRPESLVIADGIDQLVRGARVAWTAGLPLSRQQIYPLKSCLRMKRSLAQFANALARKLNLGDWTVEPSNEARGGRIIVIDGPARNTPELQTRLVADTVGAGNDLIDMLYCVPPSWAKRDKLTGGSPISGFLEGLGIPFWDGTLQSVRKDIPRGVHEARVVQYESCRGLEGWTVICLGFGEFLRNRYSLAFTEGERDLAAMASPEDLALQAAARWAMIAATRAMDTLVIEVGSEFPEFERALRDVASELPDVIEWIGG